jgi:hypothetical protein
VPRALPTGYRFATGLGLGELRQRLRELGHGAWQERESSWYGDYVAGELWGVRRRIFDGEGAANEVGTYDPGGSFLLDYARGATPTAEQDRRIREELLPSIGVADWTADERND